VACVVLSKFPADVNLEFLRCFASVRLAESSGKKGVFLILFTVFTDFFLQPEAVGLPTDEATQIFRSLAKRRALRKKSNCANSLQAACKQHASGMPRYAEVGTREAKLYVS